ncbi:MAG: DUF975 family protein [Treponema sp.]|jgi:uncharacterized membrane protein|nr:DUF975 family protein [Treponema sp.]
MNYDEIQPNSELRAYARQQLNGVWGKIAFTFFILFLIYLPCNIISIFDTIQIVLGKEPSFTSIILLLLICMILTSGAFSLGFAGYFLKRIRGEQFETKNIFDGFSRFFSSFLLVFFTILFSYLWSLLLIIPGIIKAYGYSMAFYIMYDNPKIKPLEALKKSQIMMKGYKWKLFLLQLSFIGWVLLCMLFTLNIGFIWLNPYRSLSMANFYENLKKNQEKNAMQTGPSFTV